MIQQTGQEKLILKTKTHTFHTANVSYRHFSFLQHHLIFHYEAKNSLNLISRKYLSGDLDVNLGALDGVYTISVINILFEIKNF